MSAVAQPKSAASMVPALAPELAAAIARRGIEAVNWGMPAVNFDLMYQGLVGLGGRVNEIVYWSKLADWKNQTLTPNCDTIYFMPFFTTKDGPMVLEIPPAEGGSITGTIMDSWQAALDDVGPAGIDKGKGGKYLILPPGYTAAIAEDFIVLPSSTYQGYALLRSIVKSRSEEDVAAAVQYGKQIKLYPLAQLDDPAETTFHDAFGTIYDSTIPYDIRFFRSLNRMVQAEPWLERDKAMIDPLKTLGIVKGQAFHPDAAVTAVLTQATKDAHAWLNERFEHIFEPYYEGERWTVPAMDEMRQTAGTFYEAEDTYSVDARGLTDFWAFTTVKHLGAGQFYLMTLLDKDGEPLDGSKTYRLTVPADVPIKQFWSATVYDRATHTFVRETPAPARSSQTPGLKHQSNGAVELTFAPRVPTGKVGNWVPTNPGGRFEVLFRFYGPEQPLFDKSWVLPDIEKV